MSTEPATQVYHVHLAEDVAAALDLASPIETDRIDYYDSGVWVSTDEGRDFFPYEHVLTIRERTAPEAVVAGTGGSAEPERADPDEF